MTPIGNLNPPQDAWSDGGAVFTWKNVTIGGKMVKGVLTISESEQISFRSDREFKVRLKEKLSKILAEYMLSNNLLEFTQRKDPLTCEYEIAVRCYLAPNEEIKILRVHEDV